MNDPRNADTSDTVAEWQETAQADAGNTAALIMNAAPKNNSTRARIAGASAARSSGIRKLPPAE